MVYLYPEMLELHFSLLNIQINYGFMFKSPPPINKFTGTPNPSCSIIASPVIRDLSPNQPQTCFHK